MRDLDERKPPQDMIDIAVGMNGRAEAYTFERVRAYCEANLCAKQEEVAAALGIDKRTVNRAFRQIRLERGPVKSDADNKFTTVMIDLPKSDNPAEYMLALQVAQTTMHLAGNDSGYRSIGNLMKMVANGMDRADVPPPLQRTLTVVKP